MHKYLKVIIAIIKCMVYIDQELHVGISDSHEFSYEPKENCHNRMTHKGSSGFNLQKLYIAK